MLEFSRVRLDKIIVHGVGNKVHEEVLALSNHSLSLDEGIYDLLLRYFLKPFKSEAYCCFYHESDLERNEAYHFAKALFDDPEHFVEHSIALAQRLYNESRHPQIKGGEFYVTYLKDCIIDGELVDAVGLFKSENKDTYLRVFQRGDEQLDIDYENGININKLDKGCLIFNTERENGFVVSLVDTVNKSNEAQYWKEDFLRVKAREDSFYHTHECLDKYKNFFEETRDSGTIDRKEEIVMLNKAVNYFQEKDTFISDEFEQEVIANSELITSFREQQDDEGEARESDTGSFEISKAAVKEQKKRMRSILKLDKNFHVYIHGDHSRIEKGYDEQKNLRFYKLFFEEES